jgi:hypothetical protein
MRKSTGFPVALFGFVVLLAGCGGSSGVSPSSTTTVSTSVVMPVGAHRAAGRTAEATVTSATVVLKLADGRTFTMTDNGSGTYSANISNIGGGFIIEARKGDLLLENMFTDISSLITGSTFSAGETNATSTAYVEIARSVTRTLARQLSVSGLNVDNNLNLLSSLNNATLNIDYLQLRSDVVDGGEPVYSQVVTSIATQLATANTSAPAPAGDADNVLDSFIATDSYTNQFATVYAQVKIPRRSTDVDSIRLLIRTLIAAYNERNASTFLSGMSSTFLDAGVSKTEWLAAQSTGDWFALANCTDDIKSIGVESVSAESGTAAATLIDESWCDEIGSGKTGINSLKIGETHLTDFNLIKENGAWKYDGNHEKADVQFNTVVYKSGGDISYIIYLAIDETTDYPIGAAAVSGPGFSAPITLSKETGENRWVANGTGDWIEVPEKPAVGDTYTISITFEGDSTPTIYTRTVKSAPRDTQFIALTNPANGELVSSNSTVTLAWSDITAVVSEVGNLNISFCGGENCSFRISRWGMPPSTTSVSVPTTGLTANQQINGQICYDDYSDNQTCTGLILRYTGSH